MTVDDQETAPSQGEGFASRPAWVLVASLVVVAAVSSAGWFLSTNDSTGESPDCYSLQDSTTLIAEALHGNSSKSVTFSVAESREKVTLGYRESDHGGVSTMEGYAGRLTYTLVDPLGHRKVVDPSGKPIPPCH